MATSGPKLHQSSYPYYLDKGFSPTQIDTYFPIVLAIVEKRTTDARTLLRAVLQSEGQEGVQRAEQFKKTFIAHQKMLKEEIDIGEEQKRRYELQLKQKTDLEEAMQHLSLREQEATAAIREADARKDAIINKAALEIAKNLRNHVFPSGTKHFEGKSLEQIAAFVKDLILSHRDLKQQLEFERKAESQLLKEIQQLEKIQEAIISKIEIEQTQHASNAYSSSLPRRPSQPNATAKSAAPQNPALPQQKLKPTVVAAAAYSPTSAQNAPHTQYSSRDEAVGMQIDNTNREEIKRRRAATAAATPTSSVTSSPSMQQTARQSHAISTSPAAATQPANVHLQAQKVSSSASPRIQQPAAPVAKFQLPPLPSVSPLKPKAPAAVQTSSNSSASAARASAPVQASSSSSSATRTPTTAQISSNSTSASSATAARATTATPSTIATATHMVLITPPPRAFLVQAPNSTTPKLSAKPTAAPRALPQPPTTCHSRAMATASRASVISVPGSDRSAARPAK